MKDDDLVVCREPQIALDAGAELKGCSEGEQAILGKAWAVMKPSMSEAHRARIEGISP